MNLLSLRYFIEVAKTLSFTKASENLFISQPGISQQIHLLEEQLGVKLLLRTTRRVELTPEGKYLFEKTYPSLSKIENTVSDLMEYNTFPSHIKIVTIPSAASLYLPKILKVLHENYPNIKFSIKESTSAEILKLIKNRTYHFGFIRMPPNVDSNIGAEYDYLEFDRSPIKAVVSSQHRLAHRKSIRLSELSNDYFLHFNETQSSALYHLVENACNDAGFNPKTICTGSELLTMSNIISSNIAVTLLPKDMLDLVQSPEITALELQDVHLESSIAAVWRDDGYINANAKILLQTLEDLLTPVPI